MASEMAAKQLALALELPVRPYTPPIDGGYDVYVAPREGQPEPSGPLPIFARCVYDAEQIAARAADVPADRCLALPARHWSDQLIEKLGEANRRADADLAFLQQLHAEILGIPVDQLEARLAADKAEEKRVREQVRGAAPTRAIKAKAAKGGDAIGIGRAALSERQRELLALVEVKDNFAVYTSAERIPDWDLLKRIMLALGGAWKTGGKKAPGGFRFPDDSDAAELVRLAKETGEITDPKAAELFPTPRALAELLVERADADFCSRLLEPSAGLGGIALVARERHPDATIFCIEPVEQNAAHLESLGFDAVMRDDFLRVAAGDIGSFDIVLLNPPFSRRQDIHHVRHAFKFLDPGGVLVAIMSAGVKYRDDKLATEFRAFVTANDGEIWDNPDGSFLESGTGVRTVMVRIRRAK